MAAEPNASEETKPAETPASGIRQLLVQGALVVMVALVASAVGGVVSWVMISRSGILPATEAVETPAEGDDPIRELMENGAVISLEPFVVNLADTEAPRYLRATINLMVDDKTIVDEVIENATVVSKTRDVILQTLSRKRSSEIIDEEGKDHLRSEILERLEPYYPAPRVVDVMFTEFVIQL